MIKKFKFDYDSQNDSLFVYNSKSKSKASVELDDIIIDYDSKKEISAIEVLNASNFFVGINKTKLKSLIECKVEILHKKNFIVIKFDLLLQSNEQIIVPIYIPTIHESSPAVKI